MGLTRIGANATVGQPIPPPLQSHPEPQRMRACVWYALVLFAGVPTLLSAQGFGIYEQGTCAMGRAGTGVAAPCSDGSAMFFNPAGLAGLTGAHATIGVTLIDIQGGFTDDVFQQHTELDDPLIGVPQLYISYGATSKLGIGVGLFAPYGLETRWPMTFDGRFAGYKNYLRSIYIQPTLAYQLTPRLSLGGGLDIALGKVELNQRLDLAQAPVPASILPVSPIDVLLAAPVTSGGLGLFDAATGVFRTQPVTTTIRNPAQLELGVAYKLANGWTLLGDYQLTWWSQFDELDITFPQDASGLLSRKLFENYQNTSGFRFGAEWAKSA